MAMPPITVTLPEQIDDVRTLGYACGLNTGMFSPGNGELPAVAPVQAKGPIITNDKKGFMRAFREGHDRGFMFGAQAANELAEALLSLPFECMWLVCVFFAQEQMTQKPAPIPPGLDPHIHEGVEKFRQIYKKYLH